MKRFGPLAYRPLKRIEEAADDRAKQIALHIVEWIKVNGPYDDDRSPSHTGVHLKDSYYARQELGTGDWLIKSRRRYWAYVEFGTRGGKRRVMHVRPAIESAREEFGR